LPGRQHLWAFASAKRTWAVYGEGLPIRSSPEALNSKRGMLTYATTSLGSSAVAHTYTNYFDAGLTTAARLARLRRLAWLIDGAFQLPGTKFRFGLNSIIGLLPVGGDALLGAISLYIIYEAHRLGVPKAKLAQMVANVGMEVLGGSVPILGDVFDMALKANLRNLRIIEDHIGIWR
jgi:hypothetical protein